MEFREFPKVPRLSREIVITEKLDGTNASVLIEPYVGVGTQLVNWDLATEMVGDFAIFAGSRNRWITPDKDNYGFARWVKEHAEELVDLGPGHHFGEWWGGGVQRGYGLAKDDKRFSLFNVHRWKTICSEAEGLERAPGCCGVVPILYRGAFDTAAINGILTWLGAVGSQAAPGYMDPEGIMVYHTAANSLFKKTFEGDEAGKEAAAKREKPARPPKDPSKGGRRKEQVEIAFPDRRRPR